MVAINGSTGPLLPNSKTSTEHSSKVSSSASSSQATAANSSASSSSAPSSPNAVANAVALSVKAQKNSAFQDAQVQYDAPEGKSRKALQEYFAVMSQAKREELEQMLGVDMYV